MHSYMLMCNDILFYGHYVSWKLKRVFNLQIYLTISLHDWATTFYYANIIAAMDSVE